MPKRKLAIILMLAMTAVGAVNLMLIFWLAFVHKPFIFSLAGISACIPGFVVAALAWQGRLASRCVPER